MIRPEQIPLEAKLRLRAILHDGETDEAKAIAATINAWPSGAVCHYRMGDSEGLEMVLPLPFPQEKQDD